MVNGFLPRCSSRGRGSPLTALAIAILAACGAVHAQTAPKPVATPMPAPAPAAVFQIRGFKVTGDNPLGDGETSRILAPFLRANATIETLQQATAALEAQLRSKGYGLHRVALPPQEVGDTVTLNIVTFTISKVAIEGASLYDEGNIRRSLPELREGQTPNFKTLAIQSAIANENPNKQLQVGIREADEPDRIDATITVKEARPWTFGVGLSNAGSDSSGHDRLTISGGHTNLFNLDHQFVGAYTTSVERSDDVRQFGLSYKIPLYSLGGVVGATYTKSDVVGDFGTFNSTGAGHTFGLNYTWYLPPEGGRRSYVMLAFDDKVFDASKINDTVVQGQTDRRSRPLTVGYTARTESDASVWGYNLDFAANTSSGANNDLASYQAEDPRITTTHWMVLHGGGAYTMPFATGWQFGARGSFQYTPDALISGEQFGLGGLSSVRGTSLDRPISGDKGLVATVEVTTPEVFPGLRLLGFIDAGWLGSNSPESFGKPTSDHLASLGLGLRYGKGPLILSLDYGRLVLGSKVPQAANSAAPEKGDDKLYFNLALRF